MNDTVVYTPAVSVRDIRKGIAHYANQSVNWEVSPKQRGAITGGLANAIKSLGFEGPEIDLNRYMVIGYLITPDHQPFQPVTTSGVLTPGQWIGFSRWQCFRDEWGKFHQRPTYQLEVTQVLYQARHDINVAGGMLPLGGLLLRWEYMHEPQAEEGIDELKKVVQTEFGFTNSQPSFKGA